MAAPEPRAASQPDPAPATRVSTRRISLRHGIIIALATLALAVLASVVPLRPGGSAPDDRLYGNVEMRQVDLAFNAEGRLASLARQEGDPVRAGERLGVLDDALYAHALAVAEARRDTAKAQLDLLLAGTRPEDIDQAKANVAAADAALVHAKAVLQRQQALASTSAASRQVLEDAQAAMLAAQARIDQMRAALAAAVAGPRRQDIEAARAALRAAEATVALARTELDHTILLAPSDGIVMTRVVEPGALVLPTTIVYSVALTDEVWVRAFVPEPMLGRVAPGTRVMVVSDGGHSYPARIGYVSPSAEFTPKTVETPELRTQLVYRLRVRVDTPDAALRQGMPVTVRLAAAG